MDQTALISIVVKFNQSDDTDDAIWAELFQLLEINVENE